MSFLVYLIFFFQFRITSLKCAFVQYSKTYLIDYLLRFTWFIELFNSLLIITLFLLASLLLCLLSLRLSINTKHLCFFIHSLPILTDIFRHPLFNKFNKDLQPPVILTSPPGYYALKSAHIPH